MTARSNRINNIFIWLTPRQLKKQCICSLYVFILLIQLRFFAVFYILDKTLISCSVLVSFTSAFIYVPSKIDQPSIITRCNHMITVSRSHNYGVNIVMRIKNG